MPLEEAESIPDAPAQPPVEGTVTTAAPGGGVVPVDGVTSQYLEFDVSAEHDNASMEGVATPAQPADLDLYLDRQHADGSWEEVAGREPNGGELDRGDRSRPGRLEPGHYRLEVHNYVGPPGNEVAIKLTFFDSDGNPGA